MGIKGVVLGTYALCLGGLLLFSDSGVATGLGVTLVALTGVAVVAQYGTIQ
ncbi:hypothetical protein [Halobellus inordinatus]|uniref:hypothetical protein n=1 Tax=Halobellus inordinatus TaxID=1126236 RepID=UPI00210B4859|nr:hypothetical protein [Halobellus inordinatus]